MRLSVNAACALALSLFATRQGRAEDGAGASATPAPREWAAWTASPVALDATALSSLERDALYRCGEGDAGLRDVAQAVLARKLRALPILDVNSIAQAQRAAGEPHPWPRAWVATVRPLEHEATLRRLGEWLAAGPETTGRWRRCGVASGSTAEGTSALAVVVVEALADLSPLPTRARAGQWLVVEARLRVRAEGGQILVLGPDGAPRTLLTSFDGTTLRGRFAAERPGVFAVQVVADIAHGPRPVLEARVFADTEPVSDAPRASEEPSAITKLDAAGHLASWLAMARASAGLPPLRRDPRLDRLAREHATRMAATQELAHDTGDGSPTDRLRARGLEPVATGENVVHASSVALAHRAVWESPSHRANILGRSFDRVGVGAVTDARGDTWAVELFTGDQ